MGRISSRFADKGGHTADEGKRRLRAEARQVLAADDVCCVAGSRSRAARMAWASGGFLSFGLGALGAVIPLLPTIPFLLGAAFCFARSSEGLDRWFRSTKLYREVLQGYVARRAMTLRSKVMLLGPLTIVLALSFVLMANVPVGRAVVAFVWVAHIVYFGFVVKTAPAETAPGKAAPAEDGR